MASRSSFHWISIFSVIAIIVTGCSGDGTIKTTEIPVPKQTKHAGVRSDNKNETGLFGKDGLFGSEKSGEVTGGIGVNSFLWRATLDIIRFMPITSADAFGGVIITDWHSSEDVPDERFKMNVYLIGRQLRADGVRVSVFRQVLDNNIWRDANLSSDAERKIEDAILTKARQLRNENLLNN